MSNHSDGWEREDIQEINRWFDEDIKPFINRPGEVDEIQAYSPPNESESQLYRDNSPPTIYNTAESDSADVWEAGSDYVTEAGYSENGRFMPRQQPVPFDSDLAWASPFTGYPVQPSTAGYQAQTPPVAGYQAQTPSVAGYQAQTPSVAGYQAQTPSVAGYQAQTPSVAGYQAQTPSVAGYQAQTPSVAGYQAQTPSVAGYQAQTPLAYDSEPSRHVEHGHGIAYAQSRPASRESEEGWRQNQPGVWEWLGQGVPPGSQGTQMQSARNTQASADRQNTNQEAYARVSAPSSQRYSSPSVQLVTTPSQFLDAIDRSPRSTESMTDVSDNQSEDQNHSVAGDGQRVSGSHRGDQSRVRRVRRRRRQ